MIQSMEYLHPFLEKVARIHFHRYISSYFIIGYFEGFWAHVSEEVAAYFVKPTLDSPGLYTCISCGKKEKSKTNIVTHVEYHHYSPGYDCRFCGKSWRVKNTLRRHLKNCKIVKTGP